MALCRSILDNSLHHSGDRKYPRKLILIWDTGYSYGLTSFRSDFIDDVRYKIPVMDVTNFNRFMGIGTTFTN